MSVISYPMQGVLNFIIFIRPKFTTIRTHHPGINVFVALRNAIWYPQGKFDQIPPTPNPHDVRAIAHPNASVNSISSFPISGFSIGGDPLLHPNSSLGYERDSGFSSVVGSEEKNVVEKNDSMNVD
jgi:hypothetical protein